MDEGCPVAGEVTTGTTTLYVYRHQPAPKHATPVPPGADWAKVAGMGGGQAGHVYLAWQVLADTQNPTGNWEVVIDAVSGDVITVKDRRRYATRKAFVYVPDPI